MVFVNYTVGSPACSFVFLRVCEVRGQIASSDFEMYFLFQHLKTSMSV